MFVETVRITSMITGDDSFEGALPARAAFCRLYRHFYSRIFRFAFRFTGDRYEAEDVTQETFIKLDKFLGQLHPEEPVPDYTGAWLFRVASNLCCNLVKRQSKFRQIVSDMTSVLDKKQPSVPDVETDYMEAEKQRHIRAALAQLPKRDRVLLMLYQDGMSYADMADVINVKKTSVGKLLSRAIERCSQHVKSIAGTD